MCGCAQLWFRLWLQGPSDDREGSVDVLTGIVLALLAQGYSALHAALISVFIHGYAGDEAARTMSLTAMTSADIITSLPKAWLNMEQL